MGGVGEGDEQDTRTSNHKWQGESSQLTFRTLFRTSEAILEEPPVEGGSGSLYRRFHAL
jgi:hypothetical protein